MSTEAKPGWLPRSTPARVVLYGALALSAVLKARIVFTDEGINWPDELYQSFEPAHRLVYGYALMPWEFLDGARTWFVPSFVAGWMFLCKLLGADSPATYVHVVKLVFVAVSLAAALGTYRLARGFAARELEAAVASATWSLCALGLYFSHRAMSENLAAAFVVWGVALVLSDGATRRERLIGASLLGLATLARLQSALVCVVVAALAFFPRGRRDLRGGLEVLGTLAVWALVLGLWDAAAWHSVPSAKFGGLFHSAVVYYRFNIIENGAVAWGTSSWDYFFHYLYTTMPGVSVALGVSALLSVRRAWRLVLLLAAFLLLHALMPHKELRFMVPILPFAAAFIGIALSAWPEQPARLGLAAVAATVLISAWNHKQLTMGDVGSYLTRPQSSAWDDFGFVNRLLLAANRESDLCGIRIDAVHPAWTGGITYLHRRAPIYSPGFPPQRGHFNYAIVPAGSGAQVIATDTGWDLVKLGPTCVPDPGYTWKLP
ncbi:MAG: hypothetical protein ACOZQL_18690 [Myxococcota bacterium]